MTSKERREKMTESTICFAFYGKAHLNRCKPKQRGLFYLYQEKGLLT